jgi:hypothetical protein
VDILDFLNDFGRPLYMRLLHYQRAQRDQYELFAIRQFIRHLSVVYENSVQPYVPILCELAAKWSGLEPLIQQAILMSSPILINRDIDLVDQAFRRAGLTRCPVTSWVPPRCAGTPSVSVNSRGTTVSMPNLQLLSGSLSHTSADVQQRAKAMLLRDYLTLRGEHRGSSSNAPPNFLRFSKAL